MEELQKILDAEWAYMVERPAYFIERYCRIESKEGDEPIIPFLLWPEQKKALESIDRHKLNIILKARQLGVSWLVLCYAIHTMMRVDGADVIVLSRTETEAKEMVRRVKVVLDHMGEWVGAGRKFAYTANATEVTLAGEGLPRRLAAFTSAPSAARSFTADLIIFDEWAFQQYAEDIWTSGFPTINRPGGGKVVGLSTMLQGTFFARLWQEGEFNRVFLPWTADPRRDSKWYEETRKALGEAIYSEYPASPDEAFLTPAGAFFDEFRREKHVCEPFAIPAHWRRYFAMDYGLDMLAGIWAAMDDEGHAYIYREVYAPDQTIPQASQMIREAEEEGEDIYIRYAPPDLFGRSQESGKTRTDLFRENGVTLEKSSNDREAGWANVKDWLADGPEGPKLQIFKSCPNLIRTVQAIGRDKRRPNDCARDPHELTHAPDALRYLLAMRPIRKREEKRDVRTERYYDEIDDFFAYGT